MRTILRWRPGWGLHLVFVGLIFISVFLRSDLMMAVSSAVESWQLTQTQAAARLGVTQPRLNDLLRGRINRFSLDALIGLAKRAG